MFRHPLQRTRLLAIDELIEIHEHSCDADERGRIVESWNDSRFKTAFVSINGADPAADVLKVIRESLRIAVPWSQVEQASFTNSSYRHRETKDEGWDIEVSLKKGDDGYAFRFRQITGPALAGGGTKGRLVKTHGRWVKTAMQSWDE